MDKNEKISPKKILVDKVLLLLLIITSCTSIPRAREAKQLSIEKQLKAIAWMNRGLARVFSSKAGATET